MKEGATIPLAEKINDFFDANISNISTYTRGISEGLDWFIEGLENWLVFIHPLIFILAIGLMTGLVLKEKKLGIVFAVLLFLIHGLGLWEDAMGTLALVITGTIIALVVGIPLGIAASLNDWTEKILRPILDFMQTLPSFVYLIPAVIFFGLGKVAALVAILIFSMPPAIRLTNLGIRQVPEDKIEASRAFGATKIQILVGVQLPLALKTIMAGVNQCIMMALSMSVIAAMIGAGGLGRGVLKAMQSVNIGMGIEGGLGIVLLAIVLDRATEKMAKNNQNA
ncbi:ABC transporter permease subunit [Clostridiaceae bacterium 35-E11]